MNMDLLTEPKHTLAEAAALLGVSKRTIRRYARRGVRGVTLQLTRWCGRSVVLERNLRLFVEQQNQPEENAQ